MVNKIIYMYIKYLCIYVSCSINLPCSIKWTSLVSTHKKLPVFYGLLKFAESKKDLTNEVQNLIELKKVNLKNVSPGQDQTV